MERRKFITLGAAGIAAGSIPGIAVAGTTELKRKGIRKGRVHGRFAWILLPSDQLP
jgi:hypothetical protein